MTAMVPPGLGPALLSHARAAIARRLGVPVAPPLAHPALDEPGASFVTLHREGMLRGCIGQLEATRSLGRDVEENAVAAAFRDPRFAPLSVAEWDGLDVEVSVLGPVRFQPCASEEAARRLVVPGEDGVIVASGGRRATFLPQVWAQLPTPEVFFARLLEKAGLRGGWPADLQLGIYRVVEYHDDAA